MRSSSDPTSDSDGSGNAFLTDPASGNTDVDEGPTILTSPAFDLSGFAEVTLSYDRWYDNNDPSDSFIVEISNGGPWVTVESVGPSSGSWVTRNINVTDFVALTSTVQIRFAGSDSPNDSVFEAGVDAVGITSFTCESAEACLGDCNNDDMVDFDDLVAMLAGFGGTSDGDPCDTDGNGTIDFSDLVVGVGLFGPCE